MKKCLLLVAVLALLWPAVAKAQSHHEGDRGHDRSERIARVISDCESRTNEFLRAVERAWGHDRHENDELDRSASKLERSLNHMRESWNREHNYERTRGSVGAAIDAGKSVNRILAHHHLSSHVQDEWGAIRSELNNLAEVFEQPRIHW